MTTETTMATKTTKKEMLKAAMDLLYETAVSDNDNFMLYYETGNSRYVAGRGDIDKYFEMARYTIDEAMRSERDE